MQLGLDDNREQRLVDPVPALQKRREERPRPQHRDPQLQTPWFWERTEGITAVSKGSILRLLPTSARAEHALGIRVYQRLVNDLLGDLDPLIHAGGLQFFKKFQRS